MKNFFLIAFCTMLATAGRSQTTTLTGQVKGSAVKNLQLVLLYADGQYNTSEIKITIGNTRKYCPG